eukprot:2817467-Rhodomonas_salina.1
MPLPSQGCEALKALKAFTPKLPRSLQSVCRVGRDAYTYRTQPTLFWRGGDYDSVSFQTYPYPGYPGYPGIDYGV